MAAFKDTEPGGKYYDDFGDGKYDFLGISERIPLQEFMTGLHIFYDVLKSAAVE